MILLINLFVLKQLPSFECFKGLNHIYKFKKILYGLDQAPRAFFKVYLHIYFHVIFLLDLFY